jgi:hypothetical protein
MYKMLQVSSDACLRIQAKCEPVGSTWDQLLYKIVLGQLSDSTAQGNVALAQNEADAVSDVSTQQLWADKRPALDAFGISFKLKLIKRF